MSTAKKLSAESLLADLVDPGFRRSVSVYDHSQIVKPVTKATDIVVAKNLSGEDLIRFMVKNNVSHVVQGESEAELKRKLNVAALIEQSPDRFFNFPMQTILDPTVAQGPMTQISKYQSWNFSKSAEKRAILDELENFSNTVSKSPTLTSDIVLVGDELITNAVFNAPFVDSSNSQSGIDRNAPGVQMGPGKKGQFFVGVNEDRLVIGCRDPYGRLNLKRLFQRLHDCYTKGVAQNINMGQGGAGIGSFMVFSHAAEYYAAVHADKMTVICCTFPLKISGRKRMELNKSVHIFVTDGNLKGEKV